MPSLGLLLFLYCQADWVSEVKEDIDGWHLTVAGSQYDKGQELHCGPPDARLVGRYHTRYGMQRCFSMQDDRFWECSHDLDTKENCVQLLKKRSSNDCVKSKNSTRDIELLHELFDWSKPPEYKQSDKQKFYMFRPGNPTDKSIRDFIIGSVMRGNIRFTDDALPADAAAADGDGTVVSDDEDGTVYTDDDDDDDLSSRGRRRRLRGGRRPMTFDELEEALAPALGGGASAFEDDAEVLVPSVHLAGGADDGVTRYTDLEGGNSGPGMRAPQSVSRGPKQMYDDLPDVDDDDDNEVEGGDYNPALGSTRARRATVDDDDKEEETTVLGGMM